MSERRILDYASAESPKRRRIGCVPLFLLFAIILAILFALLESNSGDERKARHQVYRNAAATIAVASAALAIVWWRKTRKH